MMTLIGIAATVFALGALTGLLTFAARQLTKKAWWFIDVVLTTVILVALSVTILAVVFSVAIFIEATFF